MVLQVAGLAPEDICLDAGRDPCPAEGLGDDVAAELLVEVALQEGVGDHVLELVKPEGYDSVGVLHVLDKIFGGAPEGEVEPAAESVEGHAGGPDVGAVEYLEGRGSFYE